jgi:hypothetical protein
VRDHGEWSILSNQEDFLEQRASLLAKRHIDETSAGNDTSYDVYQLAMAHADLAFWRGVQNQVKLAPNQHEETIKALVNIVSITPSMENIIKSLTLEVHSHHNARGTGSVCGRRIPFSAGYSKLANGASSCDLLIFRAC